MKVKDAHMQAYPFIEPEPDENIKVYHPGITLRDYFAAKAMQAFISTYPCQAIDRQDGGIPTDAVAISEDAYEMADAMMKERSEC